MDSPAADHTKNLIVSTVDSYDSHASRINDASVCIVKLFKSDQCCTGWDLLMMLFVFSSEVFDSKHMLHM